MFKKVRDSHDVLCQMKMSLSLILDYIIVFNNSLRNCHFCLQQWWSPAAELDENHIWKGTTTGQWPWRSLV